MDKKTTEELTAIPFPYCVKKCKLVGLLGAGECENVCLNKFDFDVGEIVWKKE